MNDSKSMLRFRESFRGYNKDDVNAYIEQINMIFSRREAELRAELADARTQAGGGDPAIIADLHVKLNLAEEENKRLSAELSALKEKSTGTEESEKSKLYDSMSSQVGNILIVANNNADKIKADAEAEAESIKAQAYAEADKIKADAEAKMAQMIAELDVKLKAVSEKYLSDYAVLIAEAQVRFSQVTDQMKERSKELLSGADEIGKDLSKMISEGFTSSTRKEDK